MGARRNIIVAAAVIVAVALSAVAIVTSRRAPVLPDGIIQVNGRLEGDETLVATKVPGRVVELCVREGDVVTRGQVLARLDDAQIQARLAQATQGEAVMLAQLRAARSAHDTLVAEVPLAISAAQAHVTGAEARLAKAQATEEQAARDAQRFSELADRGSLGAQKSERARLEWQAAATDVSAARAAVDESYRQLALARLGEQRVDAERHRVDAVAAQLEQARAVVADAQSVLADLVITAPDSGVVMTRLTDAGEVLGAGAPLFSIVDLDRLYLKVYVPAPQIGKVRLGLPARVFTDAFRDRYFPATVRQIASRAEFTPKEVQSRDERVKLVYAVKLYLDENPDHRLTPGLPADAVIQYDKEAPWVPPLR